jgi:hypothetical protein
VEAGVEGVPEGRPLGSGAAPPSTEHVAESMRHDAGSPGFPDEVVTKPTVTEAPGARSLFQLSGFTVTWRPSTVCVPFHSELTVVPAGRSNSSVQPDTALSVALVMTYWPV